MDSVAPNSARQPRPPISARTQSSAVAVRPATAGGAAASRSVLPLADQGPVPNQRPTYRDGYTAQNGTRVKFMPEWTKMHKVEGDGLLVALYEFLVRSDKAGEHRLRSVWLPDTVVFDHSFPSAWYAYDGDSRELVKHSGRMLDAASIYKVFSEPSHGTDIVAQFYHKVAPESVRAADAAASKAHKAAGHSRSHHRSGGATAATSSSATAAGHSIAPATPRPPAVATDDAQPATVPAAARNVPPRKPVTAAKPSSRSTRHDDADDDDDILQPSVEFFTAETLYTFLHSATPKPDGVLQKFIVPKGKLNSRSNFQLQAVWSPLVTLVYKRTNNHLIGDKSVPVEVRAASFDGPPHYSNESRVAASTQYRIDGLCKAIVDHFDATEGKKITRFVAYFKEDAKDRMWLLWASSLRIGGDKLNPVYVRVPLQLGLKVHGTAHNETADAPIAHASKKEVDKQLLVKDIAMFGMTGDMAFARLCGADTHLHRGGSPKARGRSPSPPATTDSARYPASSAAQQGAPPLAGHDDGEKDVDDDDRRAEPHPEHLHHHGGSTSPRYCASRAPFLPVPVLQPTVAPSDERHPFHAKFVDMLDQDRAQRRQASTRGGTVRTSTAEFVAEQKANAVVRTEKALSVPSSESILRDDLLSQALDTVYETYSMSLRANGGAANSARRGSLLSLSMDPEEDDTIPVSLAPIFDVVLTPDDADELVAIMGFQRAHATDRRGVRFLLPSTALTRGHRRDRPAAHVERDVRCFFDRVFQVDGEGIARRCAKHQQATRRMLD